MVKHIVCLKMKPNATPEQESTLLQKLRALKEAVPGVVSLSAGKTFTPERGQGYTIALVVEFNDREGLAAYLPHPEHVKTKEYILEVCESLLVMDYDF